MHEYILNSESRFAYDEEIEAETKLVICDNVQHKYCGLPVLADGNEMRVLDNDTHTLISGQTGAMKTRRVIMPMLVNMVKAGESIIVNDPKGELYERNKALLDEQGYKTYVLNLRNTECGCRWNPLDSAIEAYREGDVDRSDQMLRDIAENVYIRLSEVCDDKFWTSAAENYFIGLAQLVREYDDSLLTIENIMNVHLKSELKYGASNCIKQYCDLANLNNSIMMNLNGTINAPMETKKSIYSVFEQPLALYGLENIKDMMCRSDIDFTKIGKEKTAVFLIVPDENTVFTPIISMFVKMCYNNLINVSHKYYGGQLPRRVNFLLDEFSNLPQISDFDTMISASRSRNIRFYLIIQSLSQLKKNYSQETTYNILNNCNMVIMRSKDQDLYNYINNQCGTRVSEYTCERYYLISAMDIQTLDKKRGHVFMLLQGLYPFKTALPDIDEYNFELPHKKKIIYKKRYKLDRRQFDLMSILKEMHREKINIQMNTKPYNPVLNSFNNKKPKDPEVNIDDLIKKIDAKIAELEKEEQNNDNDNT